MNLRSKSIGLRFIEPSDAEFVLALRLDERYNQFLSAVAHDLAAQRVWIQTYKNDEVQGKQYYFIIERHDRVPCGTVRLYDIREESFCWGSWILNENKTRYAALESAFLVYDFGFESLRFQRSHFDVMKGNDRVIDFHLKMGARVTGEDERNIFFEISRAAVDASRHDVLVKGIL